MTAFELVSKIGDFLYEQGRKLGEREIDKSDIDLDDEERREYWDNFRRERE